MAPWPPDAKNVQSPRTADGLARHATECAENSVFDGPREIAVNPYATPAEILAAYIRARDDAAHKHSLIKNVMFKGPPALKAVMETSAKANRRRDDYAARLTQMGIEVPEDKPRAK